MSFDWISITVCKTWKDSRHYGIRHRILHHTVNGTENLRFDWFTIRVIL